MATIFRSPVLITTYKLPKAQPEYVVTLQTLYAPNPSRPFSQLDWPLAARPKPPQDAAAPANLNPLIYPNPQRPFHQDGWDRPPLLPKAKATGEVAGTINSLFTPNPSRPFSQAIWDTARTGWSKAKVDDFANLLPVQTVVVTVAPFVQSDWLNSAKKPVATGAESYAGSAALLAPNPSQPFSQGLWDGATKGYAKAVGEAIGTSNPILFPNPTAPFTQQLWENAASPNKPAKGDTVSLLLPLSSPVTPLAPFVNSIEHRVFARRDVKSDIFVNFLPLRAVAPAAPPFSQSDWPLAILAARFSDAAGVIANAILPGNAPTPPSATVTDYIVRARRRGRR